MREDPVVDEIRAVRHEISEEFAHDSDRLIDYLIKREKESAEKGQYRFVGSLHHVRPEVVNIIVN